MSIRSFVLSAALLLSTSLWAQFDVAPGEEAGRLASETVNKNQRSVADAQKIADSFWPMSRGAEQVKQTIAYTATDSADNHPCYYVFNRENGKGFVIISADSRSQKVLAYSDEGTFDINQVPEQMRAWLKVSEQEVGSINTTPDSLLNRDLGQEVLSKATARSSQAFATAVKPLLGKINYAQEFPYNNLCPVFNGKRSITGCVATGACMVMRYHKWPVTPTNGKHSYQWRGRTISSLYSTSYDWDNMLTSYKNASPSTTQQNAIAQLMYDAGVSCNMEYTPSSSGANTAFMAEQLVNLFGYDPGMIYYSSSWFNKQEFIYYLKRELNAGRPVLVSGKGKGGGHCFVCDGYDANGLFHINWGWNGMSNGYFSLSNLNPYALGSGGGTGGGYSQEVAFFGGIQPPTGNNKKPRYLSTNTYSMPLKVTKGQTFTVTCKKLSNISHSDDFIGKLGLAIYVNGKRSTIIGQTNITLEKWRNFTTFKVSGSFPTTLANGKYSLVIVAKDNTDGVWRPVLCDVSNSINVKVSGQNITMDFNNKTHVYDLPTFGTGSTKNNNNGSNNTQKQNGVPYLTKPMTIKVDSKGNATATVTLNSKIGYTGKLGVYFYDTDTSKPVLLKSRKTTLTSTAQKLVFEGTTDLAAGQHLAILYYITPENKWQKVEPKENSRIHFNIEEEKNEVTSVDPNGGNNTDDYEQIVNEMKELLKEMYGVSSVDIVLNKGSQEAYDFSDFRPQVFSKSASNAEISCLDMSLSTATSLQNSGKEIKSLRRGQADMLRTTLANNTDDEQTRIITLSLFDNLGQWVTDIAEQRVTINAHAPLSVEIPFMLTEETPCGPYSLRLTEADNDEDAPRPIGSSTATLLLQVTE